jgi:hypothetical protein
VIQYSYMAATPEIGPNRPYETPPGEENSPLVIERKEPVLSQTLQQVTPVADDTVQPTSAATQTPQVKAPSIEVPLDEVTLTTYSKGVADDGATWIGVYWLRMIKKALHFGWKVIGGGTKL